MISRRLVRVKVLQAFYAWKQSELKDYTEFESLIEDSIVRSHEFYLFLMDFPYQFHQYLSEKSQIEKSKYFPDTNKIRQYGLFSGTSLVFKTHQDIITTQPQYVFDWSELTNNFENWFNEMMDWEFVQDYLIFEQPTEEQQTEFLKKFYLVFIDQHEQFNQIMEEFYSAWIDDSSNILREIQKSILGDKIKLSKPVLSNNEELEFGRQLLKKSVFNSSEYENYVSEVTDNWDPARIAVMDLLIIKLTLSEFLFFEDIPLKVTINEYLEITKNYSTPNSSKFVNGILDKLKYKLQAEGKIQKSARGLQEK